MELIEAQKLAQVLIARHAPGWRFAWDNRTTAFGVCRYKIKTITLSKPLTERASMESVLDTILHECAHAVAGYQAGHGPIWKAHARALGAKPAATSHDSAGAELRKETAPWVGICPSGHESRRFYRKPRSRRSCGECTPGRWDPAVEYRFVKQ